jgi:hypothetical protein
MGSIASRRVATAVGAEAKAEAAESVLNEFFDIHREEMFFVSM